MPAQVEGCHAAIGQVEWLVDRQTSGCADDRERKKEQLTEGGIGPSGGVATGDLSLQASDQEI
jgi:hypothetical protein